MFFASSTPKETRKVCAGQLNRPFGYVSKWVGGDCCFPFGFPFKKKGDIPTSYIFPNPCSTLEQLRTHLSRSSCLTRSCAAFERKRTARHEFSAPRPAGHLPAHHLRPRLHRQRPLRPALRLWCRRELILGFLLEWACSSNRSSGWAKQNKTGTGSSFYLLSGLAKSPGTFKPTWPS